MMILKNTFSFIFPPLRRVAVPDSRYDFLCQHWKPSSCVPAHLHVVDIAGLVKGAHEGQVRWTVAVCLTCGLLSSMEIFSLAILFEFAS